MKGIFKLVPTVPVWMQSKEVNFLVSHTMVHAQLAWCSRALFARTYATETETLGSRLPVCPAQAGTQYLTVEATACGHEDT